MNSARILLLVALLIMLGLGVSLWRANSLQQQAVEALKPLQQSLLERDQALLKASQAIKRLELTLTVDQAALEQLRAEIKTLQDELADKTEEIRFYKGLMDPASLKKGIGFHGLTVEPGSLPQHYDFSLTVHQVAANHQRKRGKMQIELIGEQNGEKASYMLSEVSDSIASENIALSFKYFQTIEAQVVLPEAFVPTRVEVEVLLPDIKKSAITEQFAWPLLE